MLTSLRVSNRIISPYNPNYNYGANDLFLPISYQELVEGICNLCGCITHDGVYLGSNGLYIYSPWNATAYAGTIESVNIRVGDRLRAGDTLMTLADVGYTPA